MSEIHSTDRVRWKVITPHQELLFEEAENARAAVRQIVTTGFVGSIRIEATDPQPGMLPSMTINRGFFNQPTKTLEAAMNVVFGEEAS
jgi:hypothetical protein